MLNWLTSVFFLSDDKVLQFKRKDDTLDNVSSFIDKITMCLQAVCWTSNSNWNNG